MPALIYSLVEPFGGIPEAFRKFRCGCYAAVAFLIYATCEWFADFIFGGVM